jgi:4-amino-4-deoxy-L-arabinose transferase-like glycosyltransferase
MASITPQQNLRPTDISPRTDILSVLAIAAAITLLHLFTNNRYGLHRDELQFLSDARHLDWGFVAYPPLTPAVERISLALFGLNLVGLRLASVLVQALSVVVTGLMTRELGGVRLAPFTAALAVALSPLPLFEGTEFQYSSFDYLWWLLAAYSIIRLLKSEKPHWRLAIGASVGVGMETKYTMCFFVAGIVGGLLFTNARRFLLSPWFWAGAALAALVDLPNAIWQIRHGFISYHFLQHIHVRDVNQGRHKDFLTSQLWLCASAFAVPLWLAGLISFFRSPRYRMLAWMYVIPLALFYFGKGRSYYLAAGYPMLIAMGAVLAEGWLATLAVLWRRVIEGVYFTGLLAGAVFVCALLIPFATSGPLMHFAVKNNGDLREEFGWDDLVRTAAAVRDTLPADQRPHAGIIVGNYGEQGAVEILGPALGLPAPISMTNSAWLRGYPFPPPETLIVIGFSQESADEKFTSCRLAAHRGNPLPFPELDNEESRDHQDIFLCGPPRLPWPQFWEQNQRYG